MDSPQSHIWGPNLWMILHYSAERIGIPQHNRMPHEETRLWKGLLTSLQYTLPCPICKKHYTSYLHLNPIIHINKEFIRNWIYNLHSDINYRIGKPQSITINTIPEIYNKPFNFSSMFSIVNEQMLKAMRLGWITRDNTIKTIRFLQEIKRFYDFF